MIFHDFTRDTEVEALDWICSDILRLTNTLVKLPGGTVGPLIRYAALKVITIKSD